MVSQIPDCVAIQQVQGSAATLKNASAQGEHPLSTVPPSAGLTKLRVGKNCNRESSMQKLPFLCH